MNRKATGFTLIELMIVAAIIAILAAIALPSYTRYLVRSHRAAAQSYLMDLAQRQQQYLLDNRNYADTNPLITTLDPPTQGVAEDYTVTVSALNAAGSPVPNFTIQAVPVAGSLPAKYGNDTLTINNLGNKTPPTLWQ